MKNLTTPAKLETTPIIIIIINNHITGIEESDDKDEDDGVEEPPRHSVIRDIDQVMSVSDDLVYFLYENGMEEIVHIMFQVTCALEAVKRKDKLIQTDLTHYFSTTDYSQTCILQYI